MMLYLVFLLGVVGLCVSIMHPLGGNECLFFSPKRMILDDSRSLRNICEPFWENWGNREKNQAKKVEEVTKSSKG